MVALCHKKHLTQWWLNATNGCGFNLEAFHEQSKTNAASASARAQRVDQGGVRSEWELPKFRSDPRNSRCKGQAIHAQVIREY